MMASDPTPRRRCVGDAGVAVIEGALVAPILLLLLLGIFEYGLVYRDYLTISDAAANGARIGALQGRDVLLGGETADYSIISAIRQDTASIPFETIDQIVVFRAGPPSSGSALEQIPSACKTATSSLSGCNVYNARQAFLAVQQGNATYFRCVNPGDPACGFNPTARRDGSTEAIEYLGVYLRVKRPFVTALFGSTFTYEDAAIQRLEPRRRT